MAITSPLYIVNALDYNSGAFTAQTLNDAIDDIGSDALILLLKEGEWQLEAPVDFSREGANNIRVLMEPGAILLRNGGGGAVTMSRDFSLTLSQHFESIPNFASFQPGTNLRPEWWGALPEAEESDDTTALQCLVAAALAYGESITLPPGIYGYDGTWDLNVSLDGYGATIKQLSETLEGGAIYATVSCSSIPGIRIRGLTIDSNFMRPGVILYGNHGMLIEDMTSIRAVSTGFYIGSCNDNSRLIRCVSAEIIYADGMGSTGAPADGFTCTTSDSVNFISCRAEDFRRIGFVSEGTEMSKSKTPRYLDCLAEYAHDCDDSTDQFNGGFWAENTNGAIYDNCVTKNILSGVGQQSRGVRGFTSGSGTTEECIFVYRSCRVVENVGDPAENALSSGFSISGNDGHAIVKILDCDIENVLQQINILGGVRSVSIVRATFRNCETDFVNAAGVLINNDGTLESLLIDSITEVNCVRNVNGGTVNFYAPVESCIYTLRNCHGISHVMSTSAGTVAAAYVSDCDISVGGVSRASFFTPLASFSKCILRERDGATLSLGGYSGTSPEALWRLSSCTIQFQLGSYWAFGGGNTSLELVDCVFRDGGIFYQVSISYTLKLVGCHFYNYGDDGAVGILLTLPPNRAIVNITGCSFYRGDTSTTVPPIKNFGSSPTMILITGCFCDAALFTDCENITESGNVIGRSEPEPLLFGSLTALMGEPFTFPVPSNDGGTIRNPLVYVDYLYFGSGQINFEATGITWIKIPTSKIYQSQGTGDSTIWMRFQAEEYPSLYIYGSQEAAENQEGPLALCQPIEQTPGLYQFLDTGDWQTVWGWLYSKEGVLQPSEPAVFPMGLSLAYFSVLRKLWRPGVEVRLSIKFHIAGNSSNVSTISFDVLLYHGVTPLEPSLLATFSFDNRYHGGDEGFVLAQVIIQCIESLDEGATKRFRTWMELRPGSEEVSQIIDLQPQMQENEINLPEQAAFLSVEQGANDGGLAPLGEFSLLSVQTVYMPTPEEGLT